MISLSQKWKDDCIDREEDVPWFLRKHLSNSGLANFEILHQPGIVGFTNSGYISEGDSDLDNTDRHTLAIISGDRAIAVANFGGYGEKFELIGINIFKPFQGHGLGALMFKAILGIAYAREADRVHFFQVTSDGRSFWPRYGSLPQTTRIDPHRIDGLIKRFASHLSDEQKDELRFIQSILAEAPLRGLRTLSQCDIRVPPHNRTVGAVILSHTQEDDDHLSILGEASTASIMAQRLGRMPRFLPPGRDLELYIRQLNAPISATIQSRKFTP